MGNENTKEKTISGAIKRPSKSWERICYMNNIYDDDDGKAFNVYKFTTGNSGLDEYKGNPDDKLASLPKVILTNTLPYIKIKNGESQLEDLCLLIVYGGEYEKLVIIGNEDSSDTIYFDKDKVVDEEKRDELRERNKNMIHDLVNNGVFLFDDDTQDPSFSNFWLRCMVCHNWDCILYNNGLDNTSNQYIVKDTHNEFIGLMIHHLCGKKIGGSNLVNLLQRVRGGNSTSFYANLLFNNRRGYSNSSCLDIEDERDEFETYFSNKLDTCKNELNGIPSLEPPSPPKSSKSSKKNVRKSFFD